MKVASTVVVGDVLRDFVFTGVETVHSMYVMHVLYQGVRSNIVHSKPIHEKTGTRRNALICTQHSLLELPDLRDFNKLCGVQIGIVEVKTQMTDLFGVSNQFYTSDLSAQSHVHSVVHVHMYVNRV